MEFPNSAAVCPSSVRGVLKGVSGKWASFPEAQALILCVQWLDEEAALLHGVICGCESCLDDHFMGSS